MAADFPAWEKGKAPTWRGLGRSQSSFSSSLISIVVNICQEIVMIQDEISASPGEAKISPQALETTSGAVCLAVPKPHFPLPPSPGAWDSAPNVADTPRTATLAGGERKEGSRFHYQLLLSRVQTTHPPPARNTYTRPGCVVKIKNNTSMLTSKMKPGPRMGGPGKAFLLPLGQFNSLLCLCRGRRNGCEAGGASLWATVGCRGCWDVRREGTPPHPHTHTNMYLPWAWTWIEGGPRVRLGQLSLVRCCLPLSKCYLHFAVSADPLEGSDSFLSGPLRFLSHQALWGSFLKRCLCLCPPSLEGGPSALQ